MSEILGMYLLGVGVCRSRLTLSIEDGRLFGILTQRWIGDFFIVILCDGLKLFIHFKRPGKRLNLPIRAAASCRRLKDIVIDLPPVPADLGFLGSLGRLIREYGQGHSQFSMLSFSRFQVKYGP
jgi:hypothetical protein